MKKLAPFTSIIVHPGSSHNDEILSVALAVASQGDVVPVYRRNPTEDDLQNQEVLVLDQGGKVDDWSNVFDHHQFDRGAPAECTFTLLAKEMGIDQDLGAFFPWYKTWAEIDAHGPFAWAKANKLDWNAASSLLNPLDDLVHQLWEDDHGDGEVNPVLIGWLLDVGKRILGTAERFQKFCEEADKHQVPPEAFPVPVFDLTWASPSDALEFGDAYARLKGVSGGVLVSMDNRGPGLALYRRNDDPAVDFSVLGGDHPLSTEVVFAHKGGFICKTKKPEGWGPLVRAAIKA